MLDPLAHTGETLTNEARVRSSFHDGLINSDVHSQYHASHGDPSRTSISPCPDLHFNIPLSTLPLSVRVCSSLSLHLLPGPPQLLGWPFPTCTVLFQFFHPEICSAHFVFLYTCPDLIHIRLSNKFLELIVLDAVRGAGEAAGLRQTSPPKTHIWKGRQTWCKR